MLTMATAYLVNIWSVQSTFQPEGSMIVHDCNFCLLHSEVPLAVCRSGWDKILEKDTRENARTYNISHNILLHNTDLQIHRIHAFQL